MPDEVKSDPWKSLYQKLPEPIYDSLMVGLGRIALNNGIALGAFLDDDKKSEMMGPRVQVFELLSILIQRSENESLKV